jgi:Na+/melibiose symporter-like transporter
LLLRGKRFVGLHNSVSELFGNQEEFSRNRRSLLLSNYCNGVTANLIGANFFTGFLLLMNASDSYVGLIAMIAMFGNMLQVLSPLLLEQFAERKRVLMIGRGTVHFLNIVVISVIPLLVPADALKLSLILIVVLLLNVINAMMAPGYQVWHIKSIPNEIRSRYFSFFTLTNSILVYTVVLAGSQVVDAFKKGGSELTGLLIIRGLAFVLAILDLYFLSKIKEYPVPGRDIKIKDVLFSPFKEKKYLITVAIACMWSFSANIPSSFYTVYLLRELKISYSFINTVNMLSVPVMIFFMPIWRKRVDRTSWFRVFNICISLYIVHYLGLAMVTEKNLMLYPLFMLYAFAISPGINMVFANLPYVNMPEENQTNLLGFYAAMNNFAGFLGIALGRQFVTMTDGVQLQVGTTTLGNKQLVLILTAVLMLIGVLVIYRLAQRSAAAEEDAA